MVLRLIRCGNGNYAPLDHESPGRALVVTGA